VVAIDIDGVLAEYHEHLLTFMDGYFGRTMQRGWNGSGDWEDYLNLDSKSYREAKLAFRQGGMKRTMPNMPGAFSIVYMAVARGAEVWITTTRPWNRLDSVDPDTQEWLRRNHIDYSHLLYDDHKYTRLAQIVQPDRVVFVLDDLPEQWVSAEAMFPGRAFLLTRPHNLAAGEKPRRVADLGAAQQHMIRNIETWRDM
jgi:5'(3')-deoxyribonucleotidase